jgi:hypothetical protein
MSSIDMLGLIFAFLSLVGAAFFFWRHRTIAGFAFLVAFIVALSGVSRQRVVLSSAVIGVSVEKGILQKSEP